MPDRIEIERRLTIPEVAAGGIGIAYVTGYLIHAIFVRNYGILEADLVRPDYIVIGVTFLLLSSTVVFMPLGTVYLTYRVRRRSALPHFYVGLIGNSANTLVFLSLLVFLTVFVTQHEWSLPVASPVLGMRYCSGLFVTSLTLSMCGMALLPVIERLAARSARPLLVYRLVIEPLRFGLLIVAVWLVATALATFSWSTVLLTRGASYFGVLGATAVGVGVAFYWIRRVSAIPGTLPVYVLVTIGLLLLYYVAVSAYVFGVFRFIPANRGGRLPLTEALLEVDAMPAGVSSESSEGAAVIGPVYVIEESGDTVYYVAERMDHWLDEFVPIHAIRKDKVAYRHLRRIPGGFPRVPRQP